MASAKPPDPVAEAVRIIDDLDPEALLREGLARTEKLNTKLHDMRGKVHDAQPDALRIDKLITNLQDLREQIIDRLKDGDEDEADGDGKEAT